MKTSQLKLVSFSSKGYKKQLLISTQDVALMQGYLEEIMLCNVFIINTNLGLDVYYNSVTNQKVVIEQSFLVLLAKKNSSILNFFTYDLNSVNEISGKLRLFFKRLIAHPLLFKSYSKSLCYQININYASNTAIIEALFLICQDELLRLNNTDKQVYVLRPFLANLQLTYIQQSCKPELQDLLKAALDVGRNN